MATASVLHGHEPGWIDKICHRALSPWGQILERSSLQWSLGQSASTGDVDASGGRTNDAAAEFALNRCAPFDSHLEQVVVVATRRLRIEGKNDPEGILGSNDKFILYIDDNRAVKKSRNFNAVPVRAENADLLADP